MQALLFTKRELRYALSKVVSPLSTSSAVSLGPLKLTDLAPFEIPKSPDGEWLKLKPRLSGICGSDLSTLSGNSARYFESLVSFPFVMGHEIVANKSSGERVVVDAVLGRQARGLPLPHTNAYTPSHDYGHLIAGDIEPGMQIGLCESTGGGWSEELIAHSSQLHSVPEDFSDESAVLVEPIASSIHTALLAKVQAGDLVIVVGAGTIGLGVVAALRKYTSADKILVAAKHPHQQELAKELGADEAVAPEQAIRLARKILGCQMTGKYLSSGADVVIDAVGSSGSLKTAMQLVRPRGRLVVCGMPGVGLLDMSPLWHREIELCGAYAYGKELEYSKEQNLSEPLHTFDLAFDLVREAKLEKLISATYPLKDYKQAITNAFEAGKRGDSKIAFDLRG